MSDRVVVVGLGACTPVGRDAWSSAAAVRAGVSGFSQHPYWVDSAGEPISVAAAPWLDITLSGLDRLEALVMPAIDEAVQMAGRVLAAPARTALALALPSARPGMPEGLERRLLQRINQRHGGVFSEAAAFPCGHASGLVALDAALNKLRRGALDACVVAAVDSYMEPNTLEWLESCDQLHGAGWLNNAWGFVPWEAGAVVVLTAQQHAQRMDLPAMATVLGCGVAVERHLIKTESVCIGEGLTLAFRDALAPLPQGARVTDVYCDMNGEPYRADEYAFASLRTRDSFESMSDFVAAATSWGDVAAAGAVLNLVLASIAAQKGYAQGAYAFVWASAEGGERAASLLGFPARA
jgi:3-oxoacyl-[acyl-carrier-protein] synthase-1